MKSNELLKKNAEYLPNFKDILMLAGLLMTGKGLYIIYEPAMWIIIGVFLIYLGWPKGAVK